MKRKLTIAVLTLAMLGGGSVALADPPQPPPGKDGAVPPTNPDHPGFQGLCKAQAKGGGGNGRPFVGLDCS